MAQSQLHGSLAPSTRFNNQYDLQALLGGGNFGEVWRATDSHTGRVVALKLVDPRHSTPDAAWREATHLTSLESPYLIRVHGANVSTLGLPYIDMALADGSLTKNLPGFGTDESTAIRWVQRAARGLHLCHQRRLLHRDVKPDNILLSSTGDALLGDFGVTATMAPDDTADPHGDGNIRAPEVLGGGRCTVRSDVYSLGVTLFYLLTGAYPHNLANHNYNWATFIAAVQTGIPDIRTIAPHLTLGIADVVRRATSLDPQNRYSSADDMDKALARLRAPARTTREVQACHPGGRCWDSNTGTGRTTKTVHVSTRPVSPRRVDIETRHQGGNRITAHCAQVTTGNVTARLKQIFRSLQ